MSKSGSFSTWKFERRYREELYPQYVAFVPRLRKLSEDLLQEAGIPVAHIQERVKTPESVCEKIERKGYDNPQEELKDLAGIRIITCFPDDVEQVFSLLRQEFLVDEEHSEDTLSRLEVNGFGYRAVHLAIALDERRASLLEWQGFAHLWAEIQVRSLLQHSWATMSQMFLYKRESRIPHELQRDFARLSALFELADKELCTLRDDMKAFREHQKPRHDSSMQLSSAIKRKLESNPARDKRTLAG